MGMTVAVLGSECIKGAFASPRQSWFVKTCRPSNFISEDCVDVVSFAKLRENGDGQLCFNNIIRYCFVSPSVHKLTQMKFCFCSLLNNLFFYT